MDLFSVTKKELMKFFEKEGEKPFRAKQLFQWIYQKKILSFDEMTNLSKGLRESLKEKYRFSTIKLKDTVSSKDRQTYKFVWVLQDGYLIESVLILSGDRRTLCLSSQVGCRGGCLFCASGKKGFLRNLTSAEIVEQLVYSNRLVGQYEEKISNIVFMGMGEPLDNLHSVVRAIDIINDKDGLHISQRKITLSTVGLIDKIVLLTDGTLEREVKEGKGLNLKVNLTLSLHAPNQSIREELMPFATKNNFFQLIRAMKKYFLKTRRDITFEYILIEGVNDGVHHAKALARILLREFDGRGHFSLNLIPYNRVIGVNFRRPSKEAVESFKSELEKEGIKVFQRYTKGKDISAACGQLALFTEKSVIY